MVRVTTPTAGTSPACSVDAVPLDSIPDLLFSLLICVRMVRIGETIHIFIPLPTSAYRHFAKTTDFTAFAVVSARYVVLITLVNATLLAGDGGYVARTTNTPAAGNQTPTPIGIIVGPWCFNGPRATHLRVYHRATYHEGAWEATKRGLEVAGMQKAQEAETFDAVELALPPTSC